LDARFARNPVKSPKLARKEIQIYVGSESFVDCVVLPALQRDSLGASRIKLIDYPHRFVKLGIGAMAVRPNRPSAQRRNR
jgi:hypothetical protein